MTPLIFDPLHISYRRSDDPRLADFKATKFFNRLKEKSSEPILLFLATKNTYCYFDGEQIKICLYKDFEDNNGKR